MGPLNQQMSCTLYANLEVVGKQLHATGVRACAVVENHQRGSKEAKQRPLPGLACAVLTFLKRYRVELHHYLLDGIGVPR